MNLTTVSKISEFVNQSVTIQGWVYNKRSSGSIIFLQFRDGTGTIQGVIVKDNVTKKIFEQADKITFESSVALTGQVTEDKRAPSGYELQIEDVKVIQLAPDDYPIGKKEHGVDFLLNHRHLWIRSHTQWALLKIRSTIFQAVEDFYQQNGFTRFDTPVISPSACEGTTTLFEIDYFGDKAYLSQSGQLYLESAIASLGRVYDLQPVFRAEKSKTRRHLIEFWMTNAEIAYCDLNQIMEIQEQMIIYLLQRVLKDCANELNIIERDISLLKKIKPPFKRVTYLKAIEQLHKLGSDIRAGDDFGNDDETLLMNHYQQPIFVTHYPAAVKAFYMKRDPQESDKALCCDLLAPEGYGEIIGGSEREDDYQVLLSSMERHQLPVNDYQWYLDLRKYGSVPHSGFGLGIERLAAWICGLKHVRETIPFPRLLNRYYP